MQIRLAIAGNRIEDHAGRTGIDDNRNTVLRTQLVHEKGHGAANERQPVMTGHRTGDVNQENETGRRTGGSRNRLGEDANLKQEALGGPGHRGHRGEDGHRIRPAGTRIAVIEVVEELLDPDRVRRRKPTAGEHPANQRVRRGVDVGGEGGQGSQRNRGEARLVDEAEVVGRVRNERTRRWANQTGDGAGERTSTGGGGGARDLRLAGEPAVPLGTRHAAELIENRIELVRDIPGRQRRIRGTKQVRRTGSGLRRTLR